MPTNANTFNSRVTTEALEKRFRDTFTAQAGAELVNDLYASGVIVPVVDFTDAAEGSQLGVNLQTAVDFSTGNLNGRNTGTTTVLVSSSGFWRLWGNMSASNGGSTSVLTVELTDGTSTKQILENNGNGSNLDSVTIPIDIIVYLRAGDSLTVTSSASFDNSFALNYRQIADVSGNLVNPTGFTSS